MMVNHNRNIIKTVILLIVVVVLAGLPIVIVKNGEFVGADDKAEKAITDIKKDYKPWFEPIFEPKSGEIESLLFAVQAAIGAGVIGYGIGRMRRKKKKEKKVENDINR